MKGRYIPPNIWEDAKFYKIVPAYSLYYAAASIIIGLVVFFFYFRSRPIIGVIILLIVPIMIIVICSLEIPKKLVRHVGFKVAARMNNTLEDICKIKDSEDSETIFQNSKRKFIVLENKVYPWEYCPTKDKRAEQFAEEVFNLVKGNTWVSFYGICAPEGTEQLEKRYDELSNLPPILRQIENERINEHFSISKSATATTYFTRISVHTGVEDEDLLDLRKSISDSEIIGGSTIKTLAASHLIIGAKEKRGKNKEEDKVVDDDDSILKPLKNIVCSLGEFIIQKKIKLMSKRKEKCLEIDTVPEVAPLVKEKEEHKVESHEEIRVVRGRRNRT